MVSVNNTCVGLIEAIKQELRKLAEQGSGLHVFSISDPPMQPLIAYLNQLFAYKTDAVDTILPTEILLTYVDDTDLLIRLHLDHQGICIDRLKGLTCTNMHLEIWYQVDSKTQLHLDLQGPLVRLQIEQTE